MLTSAPRPVAEVGDAPADALAASREWWRRVRMAGTFSLADAGAKAAVFLALVYAARVLGPAGFGEFALVYTAAQIAALLADMGLTTLVLRQGARSGHVHQAPFWTAIALNVGASLLCMTGLVGAFALLHPVGAPIAAVYATTLLLLTATTSFESAAIVSRRPTRVATSRMVGNGCVLASTIMLLGVSATPTAVALAFVVGGVVKLACIAAATRSAVPRMTVRARLVRPLVRRATPFYGSSIAAFLYQRVDVLFLGALAGVAAAGEYAAVYRILDGVLLFPVAVVAAFLPSWTTRTPTRGASRGAGAVVVLLACIGTLVAVELILARHVIVNLLYGDEYASAARILAILAVSIPIFYADIALVWIAYAHGKEKRVALLGAAALISNVALNVVLIRELGGVGAAVATVVTEAVICVGYALALGVRERTNLARSVHLLVSMSGYAGSMILVATLCVAVQAPWAASCVVVGGIGASLLALVYRRELPQPA